MVSQTEYQLRFARLTLRISETLTTESFASLIVSILTQALSTRDETYEALLLKRLHDQFSYHNLIS